MRDPDALISTDDLSDEELRYVVDRGDDFSAAAEGEGQDGEKRGGWEPGSAGR